MGKFEVQNVDSVKIDHAEIDNIWTIEHGNHTKGICNLGRDNGIDGIVDSSLNQ